MPEIQHSQFLIIGGGIIGCSIAYHLSAMGETDITLLEKAGLTQGATWHAAGLVGQLRSSRNTTRMLQHSVELYDRLEAETGQAIDWKKVGSLRLACSEDRMLEIKRSATMAKSFGLEMQIISPKEAQDLFPLMTTDKVLGAAYIPSDGYIDPASVCQALAKGARTRGVKIKQGVKVLDVIRQGRRVTQVETSDGVYSCDVLINAAGMWSRELGTKMGVRVPACAVEHQYMITDPIPDMPKDMPTMRDPDRLIYYKPEVRGMVVGGYEDNTLPFGDRGIPGEFEQELLPENFDRFEQLALKAAELTPAINDVGIRELINGPIPYSADGDFVMGKAPELDNVFVASGFLYGIAAGGGAGKMMAEWILNGEPSLDLWPLDIRRFGFHHGTNSFMYPRAVEHYAHHYKMHYPGQESTVARDIKRSPLYEILKAKGAVYGSKFGWERPNWFAPDGVAAVDAPAFNNPNWDEYVAQEHHGVRSGVALIDQSSFAKFEVFGPDALDVLQRLAVSNIDKPVGSAIYTQLCNERGGIEADLTICRTGAQEFYVVTGSGFGTHDRQWIESNIGADQAVYIRDVTSSRAVINLCGPLARKVFGAVTEDDVSNAGFAFSSLKEVTIGAAPVRAIRIGYTGELGWELHIPTEYCAHVYGLLWQAGQEFDIINAGYRAIDRLRLEKGYVYWSADVSPDYNPFEAGLGFKVHLKSKGDFIGRSALEAVKKQGPKRQLCTFTIEGKIAVFGGETILLNGAVVGLVSSANYGHTVGKTILMGYLDTNHTSVEEFEVEAFSEIFKARQVEGPLYDSAMEKLKA